MFHGKKCPLDVIRLFLMCSLLIQLNIAEGILNALLDASQLVRHYPLLEGKEILQTKRAQFDEIKIKWDSFESITKHFESRAK